MTTPSPTVLTRVRAGGARGVFILGALITGAVSDWYLSDPEGPAGSLITALAVVFGVCITVGPWLHGVRPRRVWCILSAAGVFITLSEYQPFTTWQVGPFEYEDVTFLTAYTFLIVWFVLCERLAQTAWNRAAILDTAAACCGAVLAMWVTILAPLMRSDLATGIVWALYPPLDVAMLALAVHLTLRLRRVPPPMWWLLLGLFLWVVGDTLYAAIEVRSATSWDVPALQAVYLVAHFALATAFIHPRVAEMTPTPDDGGVGDVQARRAAIVLFTVLPVILAVAIPVVDTVDRIARVGLLGALLGLLFVRLSRTMGALADAETDSRYRATHDALTGLLNRPALFDAIERRLETDRVDGLITVLVFIDCDDFKRINDTWGHEAGDTLLCDVARRLPTAVGPRGVIARHGGDEFVALDSVREVGDAVELATRLRSTFAEPLQILQGRTHPATSSLGIALAEPGEECSTADLLARADTAMYAAKAHGKGRSAFFDDDLAAELRQRQAVGDRLGRVIGTDPFTIALQPIMSGPGYHRLVGWEARARWRDDVLGEVPPEVFVGVAEDLGLSRRLGELLLRHACRRLHAVHLARPEEQRWVSVAVFPMQLRDPQFVDTVRTVLEETDVPGTAVRLEIPESVLQDGHTCVGDVLEGLRTLGVQLCVDDFGAGYASLGTLMCTPADAVKLDRGLVRRVVDDDGARRQLAAVLALVRSLGIRDTVAEGVESRAQEVVLERLGCPSVQGRWYESPDAVEGLCAPGRRRPWVEC